jgi:hypothetical protein
MTEGERLRELENRLWQAADQLRANSTLSASQYSTPVLGLIFLRYADVRFTQAERELEGEASSRREIGKADYQALGVMYLPETARFSHLRSLPKGEDIGAALNRAMEAIEEENPDLKGVLPRDYARFESSLLAELIRLIGSIPDDIEGDAFGKIYEYFLGRLRNLTDRLADLLVPTLSGKAIGGPVGVESPDGAAFAVADRGSHPVDLEIELPERPGIASVTRREEFRLEVGRRGDSQGCELLQSGRNRSVDFGLRPRHHDRDAAGHRVEWEAQTGPIPGRYRPRRGQVIDVQCLLAIRHQQSAALAKPVGEIAQIWPRPLAQSPEGRPAVGEGRYARPDHATAICIDPVHGPNFFESREETGYGACGEARDADSVRDSGGAVDASHSPHYRKTTFDGLHVRSELSERDVPSIRTGE